MTRPRTARKILVALLLPAFAIVALSAGIANAQEDDPPEQDVTFYDDGNGNITTTDPGYPEEPPAPEEEPTSTLLVGRWFSDNGTVVRFDAGSGYVETGRLGPCSWPDGNRYFKNIKLVSGVNVLSASTVSNWEESAFNGGTPTCRGVKNVKYQASALLTVNGNTLTVTGTNGGVSSYTRADRAPAGYLDSCAGGWARDDDWNGPVDVHIYANGAFYTSVLANTPSSDVGAHRFSFTPPAGTTTITAYALGRDSAGNGNHNNPALPVSGGGGSSLTCTR